MAKEKAEKEPVLTKGEIDTIIFLMKDKIKEVIQNTSPQYRVVEITDIRMSESGDIEGSFVSDDGKNYSFVFEGDEKLKITMITSSIDS